MIQIGDKIRCACSYCDTCAAFSRGPVVGETEAYWLVDYGAAGRWPIDKYNAVLVEVAPETTGDPPRPAPAPTHPMAQYGDKVRSTYPASSLRGTFSHYYEDGLGRWADMLEGWSVPAHRIEIVEVAPETTGDPPQLRYYDAASVTITFNGVEMKGGFIDELFFSVPWRWVPIKDALDDRLRGCLRLAPRGLPDWFFTAIQAASCKA